MPYGKLAVGQSVMGNLPYGKVKKDVWVSTQGHCVARCVEVKARRVKVCRGKGEAWQGCGQIMLSSCRSLILTLPRGSCRGLTFLYISGHILHTGIFF